MEELLLENARLEAENKQLKAMHGSYVAGAATANRLEDVMEKLLVKITAERDALRAENERLKAEASYIVACEWRDKFRDAETELLRLKRLAPLCEQHGTGKGARSGCPYCGLVEMTAALSRIDYLTGPPNEMQCSGYDVHCNEEEVVKNVERLRKVAGELAAQLDQMIQAHQIDSPSVRAALAAYAALNPQEKPT